MNARLSLIASLIPPGVGFVDVGTDHGYLPAHIAQTGYAGRIIASDIRHAPLSTAVATAREADVEDKIGFRLCDGLEGVAPDEVDTLVVAGMGGDTISGILDRAEWCMDSRYLLLLQPMTKAEILRYWLVNNGFEVSGEYLIRDGGEIYQLISARFGAVTVLSDAELFSGRYELLCDDPLFPQQISLLIRRFERALDGLERAKRPMYCRKLYQGILDGLYQMKKELDAQ